MLSTKLQYGQSLLLLLCCVVVGWASLRAAETDAHFEVRAYAVEGHPLPSTNTLTALFSKYLGTNVGVEQIVQAASDLQLEYRNQGQPVVSIAFGEKQITNGLVTLHAYQSTLPLILVSGRCLSNYTGTASAVAPKTNAAPHFTVQAYEVSGNSLLADNVIQSVFSKYTGTNVTFADIGSGQKDLQMEYHNRGFDTVLVTIPPQRLTNAIVKVQVLEGRLAEINVTGNRYFSSNNIMKSLPGLRTNQMLNSKLFQAELDRANANQDRQIYPQIGPGPEEGSSALLLKVKDRLPLHAKVELNNQSSPGTPEMRLNSSAVYNNLWQEDHSLGVQYSFSPEGYKGADSWNFYDRPLVANYSAFYRLPLAAPNSLSDEVANRSGRFGYDEATRKFELPPASGTPELNVYGSRATIDTGVKTGSPERLFSSAARTIDQRSVHEDLTINEGIGFRLSEPLREFGGIRSRLSVGLDFKSYTTASFATNQFIFTENLLDSRGNPFTRISLTPSPVPSSGRTLKYLPLALRWDAGRSDALGRTDFGFSYSPNLWFSGTKNDFRAIAGSAQASGFWHVLGASLAREQILHGQWKLNVRMDGQWATEPLISNEQFGVGGVGGVRGYREGETFGSTGWRVTSEVKTPPYRVGYVGAGTAHPLTVRGSMFMDYAETYTLDAQPGQLNRVPLWGTGLGAVASIGSVWDVRLLFAVPLLRSPTSEAGQLRISFALTAEF